MQMIPSADPSNPQYSMIPQLSAQMSTLHLGTGSVSGYYSIIEEYCKDFNVRIYQLSQTRYKNCILTSKILENLKDLHLERLKNLSFKKYVKDKKTDFTTSEYLCCSDKLIDSS